MASETRIEPAVAESFNDWFERGYENGKLDATALLAALAERGYHVTRSALIDELVALREALPDETQVAEWPGGGGRVSRLPDSDGRWLTDHDGAWVVLYAPRRFYDGLRRLRGPE